MGRPILAVIGGLSVDTIHLVDEIPEPGQMVEAEKFVESGGRAANIAVAANRSCHHKPASENDLLPDEDNNEQHYHPDDDFDNDESIPEIRIIAAVAEDKYAEFTTLMRQNGVKAEGLRVFPGSQSEVYSLVQRDTGRARQTLTAGVEKKWERSDFDTPEKLGNGAVPDLVVTTTELKQEVVEQIIETAHAANIDVIVYASPAISLLGDLYPKITHLVLDEGDANTILGYPKGYVTIDNWHEISDYLYQTTRVKNVVLKLGPYGAYFRNENEEGYASGYTKIREIADATGSTGAFVGAYAVEYLKSKSSTRPTTPAKSIARSPPRGSLRPAWQISEAAILGNKVCAFCVVDIGCINATPWKGELWKFDDAPWFKTLEALQSQLRRRKTVKADVKA